MSSLWTPGGERPIRRDPPVGGSTAEPGSAGEVGGAGEPTPEELRAQMAELQEELARTPASVVVVNHVLGLFNLARLHLSLEPPQLDQARLAIDAMAALVEGLGDRLGEDAGALSEGLAQLRIAYVQIHSAQPGGGGAGPAEGGSARTPGDAATSSDAATGDVTAPPGDVTAPPGGASAPPGDATEPGDATGSGASEGNGAPG
jgi:hypothetical protein